MLRAQCETNAFVTPLSIWLKAFAFARKWRHDTRQSSLRLFIRGSVLDRLSD